MTPRVAKASATAISTYYDVVAGAGASQASLLILITARATTTTAAGKLRLWLYDGSTRQLLTEVPITVVTSDNDEAGWSFAYRDEALCLNNNSWKIQAELTVANNIDLIARVEDL
jgi:hypothetical protein